MPWNKVPCSRRVEEQGEYAVQGYLCPARVTHGWHLKQQNISTQHYIQQWWLQQWYKKTYSPSGQRRKVEMTLYSLRDFSLAWSVNWQWTQCLITCCYACWYPHHVSTITNGVESLQKHRPNWWRHCIKNDRRQHPYQSRITAGPSKYTDPLPSAKCDYLN